MGLSAVKEERQKNVNERVKTQGDIYTFIFETFKKYKVPVDHFGNFYSKGAYTVDKQVSPNFSDQDYIIALLLDLKDKRGV